MREEREKRRDVQRDTREERREKERREKRKEKREKETHLAQPQPLLLILVSREEGVAVKLHHPSALVVVAAAGEGDDFALPAQHANLSPDRLGAALLLLHELWVPRDGRALFVWAFTGREV